LHILVGNLELSNILNGLIQVSKPICHLMSWFKIWTRLKHSFS